MRFSNIFLFALIACCFVGCGEKELPLVNGHGVLVDASGDPVADVRLTFMPDAREKNFGQSSTGKSMEDGKFELATFDASRSGVLAGKHRVTLSDLRALRAGRGGDEATDDSELEVTNRIPTSYITEDGALLYEVVEGTPIKIVLPFEVDGK